MESTLSKWRNCPRCEGRVKGQQMKVMHGTIKKILGESQVIGSYVFTCIGCGHGWEEHDKR